MQRLADPVVDGLRDQLAVGLRVRLLPGRERGCARFRGRLVHPVQHAGLIVHTVGDAGNDGGQEIEGFAQLVIGEGRELGLIGHGVSLSGLLGLGSMTSTDRSTASRFGITVPTPFPARVGARVIRWAGPS